MNKTLVKAALENTEERIADNAIDTEIVKKAAEGDDEAFSVLFMQTYRYVCGVARAYLKNDEDVYDVVQEAYTKAYANISRIKSHESFLPWLAKIAENCSKDILSKATVSTDVSEDDEFLNEKEASEDKAFSQEVLMDITAVFEKLSADDAKLLSFVYYDGFTVRDVARMQGLAATTVYSRLNAAKHRLRELLKIKGIEKPVYGGDLATVITAVIRNALGTNMLSAAVAEEILQSVIGKNNKAAVVISAVARNQRNTAILRVASIVVLLVVLTTVVTAGIYFSVINILNRRSNGDNGVTAGVSTESANSLDGDSSLNSLTSITSSEESVVSGEESSDAASSDTSGEASSTVSSTPSSTTSSTTSSTDTSSDSDVGTGSAVKPEEEEELPDIDLTEHISNVSVFSSFGNSSNNLQHDVKGEMARDEDWLYFSYDNGFLFRVTPEGDNLLHIYEADSRIINLNVQNGYIMFTIDGDIYRMKTDERLNAQKMSLPKKAKSLYAIDGKLYAMVGDEPYVEAYVCTIGEFTWEKIGKGYETLYFTDDGKAVFYKKPGSVSGRYDLCRFDLYNQYSVTIATDICDGSIMTCGDYVIYPAYNKVRERYEMRLVNVYHPNKILYTHSGTTCAFFSPYKGGVFSITMGIINFIKEDGSIEQDTGPSTTYNYAYTFPGEDYMYFRRYENNAVYYWRSCPDSVENWITPI